MDIIKRIFIIVYLVLITFAAKSQITLSWFKSATNNLQFTQWDNNRILLDGNNDVISGAGGGGIDICPFFMIKKYNGSTGQELWSAGATGYLSNISRDNSNNIYVAYFTSRENDFCNTYNVFLRKYNSSGQQQFTFVSPLSGDDDVLADMTGDAQGNSYLSVYRGHKMETSCFSAGGSSLWVTTYSEAGSDFDQPVSIICDNLGNAYVLGYNERNDTNHLTTIKYNSAGIQQWVSTYREPVGNNYLNPVKITLDAQNNAYVLGYITEAPSGIRKYVTIKYNSSGVQQWAQIASVMNGYAYEISVDQSGNVYSSGAAGIIKYNSSGVQQWFDSLESDVMEVDGNSFIYQIRNQISPGGFLLRKLNVSGTELWRYHIDSSNTHANGEIILTDNLDNIYIGGKDGNPNLGSILTYKFASIIGIEPISSEIPNKYLLYQNYPNPFNPVSKIRFQIPKKNDVNLSVFDALGNEAAVLVSEELNPGVYEVNWDASVFSSGVYFYMLKTGEFAETKKMVLIK